MATSAGVFLGLAPWAVLAGFVIWVVVALGTGYVSLASVVVSAALPPLIAFTPHEGGSTLVGFSTALAIFVIVKHRSNIGRLMRGEENRFRFGAKPGSEAQDAGGSPTGGEG